MTSKGMTSTCCWQRSSGTEKGPDDDEEQRCLLFASFFGWLYAWRELGEEKVGSIRVNKAVASVHQGSRWIDEQTTPIRPQSFSFSFGDAAQASNHTIRDPRFGKKHSPRGLGYIVNTNAIRCPSPRQHQRLVVPLKTFLAKVNELRSCWTAASLE